MLTNVDLNVSTMHIWICKMAYKCDQSNANITQEDGQCKGT